MPDGLHLTCVFIFNMHKGKKRILKRLIKNYTWKYMIFTLSSYFLIVSQPTHLRQVYLMWVLAAPSSPAYSVDILAIQIRSICRATLPYVVHNATMFTSVFNKFFYFIFFSIFHNFFRYLAYRVFRHMDTLQVYYSQCNMDDCHMSLKRERKMDRGLKNKILTHPTIALSTGKVWSAETIFRNLVLWKGCRRGKIMIRKKVNDI